MRQRQSRDGGSAAHQIDNTRKGPPITRRNRFGGLLLEGKVYVIPDARTRSWQVLLDNRGSDDLGLTTNVLPPGEENAARHDDLAYGHGLRAAPKAQSWIRFTEGDLYNARPIREGDVLRLGIRGAAVTTLQLPPLDSPPQELDVRRDFQWYGRRQADPGRMALYEGDAEAGRLQVNAPDGQQLLARVQRQLERRRPRCRGQAAIVAKADEQGQLSHWEVFFENTGAQAWIGTISFAGRNKNDGIGLESMPCPGRHTAAMQRIEAGGNYGQVAHAGRVVRLGIRGWAHLETRLPSLEEGEVRFSLRAFERGSSAMEDAYFDERSVREKRAEKLNRVKFAIRDADGNWRTINDELRPVTYRGADAQARSTFDAPRLTIRHRRAVNRDGTHLPEGWTVTLHSRLPERDQFGPLGFTGTVKLGQDGRDHTRLKDRDIRAGSSYGWFIPRGLTIGENTAQTGQQIVVGARGTGWFCTVALPKADEHFDSDQVPEVWGFREDQYDRSWLTPPPGLAEVFAERFPEVVRAFGRFFRGAAGPR